MCVSERGGREKARKREKKRERKKKRVSQRAGFGGLSTTVGGNKEGGERDRIPLIIYPLSPLNPPMGVEGREKPLIIYPRSPLNPSWGWGRERDAPDHILP